MLDRMKSQESNFQSFLNARPQSPTDDAQRDALFREFLQWQQKSAHQK
jgi:hypothetical protein